MFICLSVLLCILEIDFVFRFFFFWASLLSLDSLQLYKLKTNFNIHMCICLCGMHTYHMICILPSISVVFIMRIIQEYGLPYCCQDAFFQNSNYDMKCIPHAEFCIFNTHNHYLKMTIFLSIRSYIAISLLLMVNLF
jgi:hypothetical protein